MSNEFPIRAMDDLGEMLLWMAKRLKISITALSGAGGVHNSSLSGFATGSKRSGDLNAAPLLRVLEVSSYELVTRPKKGDRGVMIKRENSHPLLVVGLDGGPIEITWNRPEEIPLLLNTLAMARDLTVTGLVKQSGINSTSLVSLAMGNSANKDVRMRGLLRVIDTADFTTICRPIHATRREARMAMAAAWRV